MGAWTANYGIFTALILCLQGLRMNRTLLCLGLANNKIGNHGAKKVAEAISRFPLSHEEIVERRKLLSEKGAPEGQKSVSIVPFHIMCHV